MRSLFSWIESSPDLRLPADGGTCNFRKNGDNDGSSSPWRTPVQMTARRLVRSAVAMSSDRAQRVVTIVLFALLFFSLRETAGAQNAAPAANADPTYQALRNLTLSGEAVTVSNVELKRDAGTFHL